MTLRLVSIALLAAPLVMGSAPLAAQPRALTPDERMGLTCASAFALVAAGQARGEPAMKQYPPLAERGRAYFVQLAAQLMDDAGLDQAGIRAAAQREAEALRRTGVEPVMPTCLHALDQDMPAPAR